MVQDLQITIVQGHADIERRTSRCTIEESASVDESPSTLTAKPTSNIAIACERHLRNDATPDHCSFHHLICLADYQRKQAPILGSIKIPPNAAFVHTCSN